MLISRVRKRKGLGVRCALAFGGALLALLLSLGTAAQDQTLFTDYHMVSAVNAGGEGADSSEAGATPMPLPPPPPGDGLIGFASVDVLGPNGTAGGEGGQEVTVSGQAYSLSARPTNVAGGAPVTVSWSAPAGHSAIDWVGLYRVGDPDISFISWQYTGDATSGEMIFAAPLEAGQHEFRYFLNDGYTRAATSNTVVVTPTPIPLAFPGAEGYGAFAAGGRGGDVYHVTNLNDSGEGSLRYGIQTANGPRTIVFDLSGTIYLQSRLTINKPYLTLAGQTAPGDGITVAGWTTLISNTHDVVVRYMRFRPGDINCPRLQDDSLSVDRSTDIIIDHVSASWSIDETSSVTNSDRVTVQWSLVTESLNNSCHLEGQHGYGSLLRYGSGGLTFHHNLYAHHNSRNPRLGDNLGLDFVNNVVYSWGGDAGYSGAASEGTSRMNYVANYVIAGPSTPASRRNRAFRGGSENTLIYQSDNLIDSNVNGVRDGVNTGWAMFVGSYTQQSTRFDFPQVQTDTAEMAYIRVLGAAGHSLTRDSVDARVVSEVSNDGGSIIDSQSQVGGWPDLETLPPPLDSDRDGIPDKWEVAHELNPSDPSDGSALTESGYSNLEVYLNELVLYKLTASPGTITAGEN